MSYNKRRTANKGRSTKAFNYRAAKTMGANKRPLAMRGGNRF